MSSTITTTTTITSTVESKVNLINKNYDKHSGNGIKSEQQYKQLEHVKEIKILTKTPVIPDTTSQPLEKTIIIKKNNEINTSEENNHNCNEINEKSVKMCEKNIVYDINHNESQSISRVILGTEECIQDIQVLQANEQVEAVGETLKLNTDNRKINENLKNAVNQKIIPAKTTIKSKSSIGELFFYLF